MGARFTVLSDTPIAAAISGFVMPLSRNSTIWMRLALHSGHLLPPQRVFQPPNLGFAAFDHLAPSNQMAPSESHLR